MQLERLRKYAYDHGWQIAGESWNLVVRLSKKRPGLITAKKAIRSKRSLANCILVWDAIKLGGDIANILTFIQDIEQMCGKVFSYLEGSIDSSLMSFVAIKAFLQEELSSSN